MAQNIVIIDYGVGNLASLKNAFDYLGYDIVVTSNILEVKKADKLILPGVGAFKPAIEKLRHGKFNEVIVEKVDKNIPLLGICLGMQLLFTKSYENGVWKGLDLIDGEVLKIEGVEKVPHMGWNSVEIIADNELFRGIRSGEYFYFVHSYYCRPAYSRNVIAVTEYGRKFCVATAQDYVYGVQFHPEKSHKVGLKLLENFAKL
ncbi:MAG: imidazole glycerol phosphate synthase subunit HisH [Candidatus Marinimicrobia bacterium]|nr:imidazole glycerol phosphate synthase subunit HisH [Candidatus Neomarinimicrobiota bacterium]